MTPERPAITLEYFDVTISSSTVELDAQPVHLAFMLVDPETGESSAPDTPDWVEAAWVGDAGPSRMARVLVGPGGAFEPTPDSKCRVWYWITDDPEVPKRPVGTHRFT